MSVWEKVVWGLAIVIVALSVLSPPAWPILLLVALLLIAGSYGLSHWIDLEKSKSMGERANVSDIRHSRRDE